jgi:hypothetical protein
VTSDRSHLTGWSSLILTSLALIAGVLGTPQVGADIHNPILTIHAENNSGISETFSVAYDEACWSAVTQTYTWSLSSSVELLDGSTLIAKLQNASVVINAAGTTPQIDLSLDVIAGPGTTSTDYTSFFADTARLSFPTIPAGQSGGRLVTSAEVWDRSEPANEVWLIGLTPSYGSFQACYNGAAPDGSVFAEVLGVVGMPSGGSGHATGSQSHPSSGFEPIGVAIDDMRVHAAFELSPNDQAVTNSFFGLIPEPTGLVLLATGGALIGRRRRT